MAVDPCLVFTVYRIDSDPFSSEISLIPVGLSEEEAVRCRLSGGGRADCLQTKLESDSPNRVGCVTCETITVHNTKHSTGINKQNNYWIICICGLTRLVEKTQLKIPLY